MFRILGRKLHESHHNADGECQNNDVMHDIL